MKCDHTCAICAKHEDGSWADHCAKRMIEKSLCFHCNLWDERTGSKFLVIDGWTYSPGHEPSPEQLRSGRGMLGMSGRRFDIELSDGRVFTTHNLWSGGEVPAHFRDKFPDNAKFASGSREKVGDTTCFNPADPKRERFPTYQQLLAA